MRSSIQSVVTATFGAYCLYTHRPHTSIYRVLPSPFKLVLLCRQCGLVDKSRRTRTRCRHVDRRHMRAGLGKREAAPLECAASLSLLNSAASPARTLSSAQARLTSMCPLCARAGLLHATSSVLPPRTTPFIFHGPNKRRCARLPPLQLPSLRACCPRAVAACFLA